MGDVIGPMILVNAAGMGLFVFIVHNEERERLTAAQKERMEGELTVARDIQRSIVPMIFPPFPEREEFDLHASLEPAREVGGDLYDFFLLDDDHLCIAIGDVAGKGVPASLFMAVTITLLRAAGARSSDPAEVLARVNEPLCRGNDAAMFVTLFYGVYCVSTGELTYSTGGHLPPYVLRAGGVETAARTAGPGLGISPGGDLRHRRPPARARRRASALHGRRVRGDGRAPADVRHRAHRGGAAQERAPRAARST